MLDVRLGADASAYGSAEKTPGTGLARVPVELFEQLAAGARIESVADFERTETHARSPGRTSEPNELEPPPAPLNPRGAASNLRIVLGVVLLATLLAIAWLMRRGIR